MISDDHAKMPSFSLKGKGWYITLERLSENAYLRTHDVSDLDRRELVVHAASRATAQAAMDLVIASAILSGNPERSIIDYHYVLSEEDLAETDWTLSSGAPRPWGAVNWPYITVHASIAAKASFRRAHQYAIHKYRLSRDTAGASEMELDPDYWSSRTTVTHAASDHVCFTQAIILAYSAIEELELEIRASYNRPSRLPNGQWNPVVRQDSEKRLKKAGVAPSENVIWYLRGTPTRIERTYGQPPGDKATWSYSDIRDTMVNVCDAILCASTLRSRISAHRLPKLAASLTSYDVASIQDLVARLILMKLGFYRWWENGT